MKHIYVGNIGLHISEAGLRSQFEVFGEVKQVHLGLSYAVIAMVNDAAAEQAISDLNSRTAWVLRPMPPFYTPPPRVMTTSLG